MSNHCGTAVIMVLLVQRAVILPVRPRVLPYSLDCESAIADPSVLASSLSSLRRILPDCVNVSFILPEVL